MDVSLSQLRASERLETVDVSDSIHLVRISSLPIPPCCRLASLAALLTCGHSVYVFVKSVDVDCQRLWPRSQPTVSTSGFLLTAALLKWEMKESLLFLKCMFYTICVWCLLPWKIDSPSETFFTPYNWLYAGLMYNFCVQMSFCQFKVRCLVPI